MLADDSNIQETIAPPLFSRAWLIVALLWVVGALNYLDRTMISSMRESLTEAIPMSDTQFGMLGTTFLWVYGAFSPFAGFLADRFGYSRVIIISVGVWSAITWWTGHARSFEELLLARGLMGISEACYIPAALALIMEYHRGPTRSLANGIHISGICFGGAAGGVGGWLAAEYGWSFPFQFFGIFGIVYALFLLFLLREPPRAASSQASTSPSDKAGFGEGLTVLFGNGSFIMLITAFSLMGFAGWVLNHWMPTYLQGDFGLSQKQAGLYASVSLQGLAMIGVIFGGFWADYLNRTNPRARTLVPFIGLTIAAFGVLLAGFTVVLPLVLVGLAAYGLARVFADANMMPILCQVCDPRYRATGYGFLNAFACFVGGIATLIGGALRDYDVNLSYVFLAAGAGLIVAAVLLLIVGRLKSPERT